MSTEENLKQDQSVGDWLANEGYCPLKQKEIIRIVEYKEGIVINLNEMLTVEIEILIKSTLQSIESEEYSILNLVDGKGN